MADWKTHEIHQLNGKAERIKLPAKLQILMESWIEAALLVLVLRAGVRPVS